MTKLHTTVRQNYIQLLSGEKYPSHCDYHLPLQRHLSTLLDCMDWSEVSKISSVHDTTVTGVVTINTNEKCKTYMVYTTTLSTLQTLPCRRLMPMV